MNCHLTNKQVKRLVDRLLDYYSYSYLSGLTYDQLLDLIRKLFSIYLCMDNVIEGIFPGSNFNQYSSNWSKFLFFLKLLFGYWKARDKRAEFAKAFLLATHLSGKYIVLNEINKLSNLSLFTFLQRINYLLDLSLDTWLIKQSVLFGTFAFFSFQIYKYFLKKRNYLYLKKLQKHGRSTLLLLHLFFCIYTLNERVKKKIFTLKKQ